MSTPEEKLVEAAKQETANLEATGKAWYARYQTWLVAASSIIVGLLTGHYVR